MPSLKRTLLVVPCSEAKEGYQELFPDRRASILTRLHPTAACKLQEARARVAPCAKLGPPSDLLSALSRYSGTLYKKAAKNIEAAYRDGLHVLILSGGYGLLLPEERIRRYDAELKKSCWGEVLEEALSNYVARHAIKSVFGTFARTTDYAKVFRATQRVGTGAACVTLITPDTEGSRAPLYTVCECYAKVVQHLVDVAFEPDSVRTGDVFGKHAVAVERL